MKLANYLDRIIRAIEPAMRRQRTLLLTLSIIVVFVTTYVLILPALTLDKEKAGSQGGIDIPSVEQTSEEPAQTGEVTGIDEEEPGSGEADLTQKPSTGGGQTGAVTEIPSGGEEPTPAEVQENEPAEEPSETSGKSEIDLGTAIVSTVDGSDLPEDADGHARAVNSKYAINQVGKQIDDLDETAQFQVFDIALDNVDESDYEGFKVDVALPENVTGKNFRLFHLHDGEVEELDVQLSANNGAKAASSEEAVNAKTGDELHEPTGELEEISGFTFETSGFSQFILSYTVDFAFELDGKTFEYSISGGDAVGFRQLIKDLGILTDGVKVEGESPALDSKIDEVLGNIESVKFSKPKLLWVEKVEEDTATWKIMQDNRLLPQYPQGTTDQEFCTIYIRQFKAPDWVLIALKPFDTEETLTIKMKTGEEFVIKVTDAQDAPIIDDGQGGQIVQTINNPNGTTIDLFDYWITDSLRNSQGKNGWPGHTGDAFDSWDFDWYDYSGNRSYVNHIKDDDVTGGSTNYYVENGYLRGNGNNQGINSGHVFKFYPGAAGTVEDYGDKGSHIHGQWNAWTNNHDHYSSINSWTGTADPTTGLVQPYLNGQGYPQLTNDASKGTDGSALNYLFDDTAHAGKQKYEGVNNLLYVNPDGYYTYDSWYYSADFDKNSKDFTLREHASNATQAQKGFWPFGDRVNWHGMHMTVDFSMPVNGQVLNPKGVYKDMEFEFHGDDDTWLYIDGILVGDGGGIHNHTKININFKTGLVLVTGTDDPVADHVGTYTSERYLDDIFRDALAAQGKSQAEINAYIAENFDGHTFKQGAHHTFEMFYLERGGSESNLFIKYNLVSTTDFSAHKSYHMLQNDPHARLERDQFKFELIGFDNTDLDGTFQQAIMPANGTPTGDGTYANPKKMHYEATASSPGYTSLITGVTEDGNVNFGNIQVQASQAGMSYKYMVREVVDPDAENADGIAWKDATEEQRAEGGFIDSNGITYDGRVYYFIGTVQETSPGSGQYELKKTRYTDETYSEIDTKTKFFSFVNGHVEPLTLKVLKKSDTDNHKPLSGAQFSLVRAKHVVTKNDQGETTEEKWIVRPESTPKTGTTANGNLSFDGLTEGHYILEETAAPAGYTRNETYRWLLTLTKEDSADEIVLVPTIRPIDADGHATGEPVTLTVNNDHVIEHEVLNGKLPRGPLTVEKKWLKPDGETEYTAEELAELGDVVQNTQITGELWRRYTTEEQVGTFTLDEDNNWKVTWTSDDLQEDDYDYEYYLKNVSEPELEGYTFIKDPEITTETVTGHVTYAVKNIKDGPKTDLTVRKVWGDNVDHSGDTISYKIQRSEFNADGGAVAGPYDYIETGKTEAVIYTLSASDVYNEVAWQKHHEDLPATNGKEETDPDYRVYKYSVVEVNPPANYTASYLTITEPSGDEEPYEITVIKNNPTDARVSVEKKWMNNGKTEEITTGLPEGAYITGTLKKSYTWQEASGSTVRVYNRLWANGQILSTTLYRTYPDVQTGSGFSLWAIDSNGNEPLNGVQANGSAVSQTGDTRTYNMGSWSDTTQAYVVPISGDTEIILDWAYNTGFQNGWHYDVDYTQASGNGGQSHSETETVGTFRIDASNDWKWVWTDRELDQNHVYTYFFENVQEHTADGTVVANFDGFNPPEVGQLTQGADGRWTASIINEQVDLKTELTLKKVDLKDLNKDPLTADDLLAGAKFKLEKYTSLQPDVADEAWNSEFSVETAGNGDGTFTFSDLPVGYYKIVETDYPDGYSRMEAPPIVEIRKVEGENQLEVIQVNASGEPIADTTGQIIRIVPNQATVIVGNERGIELPHTGGIGTVPFTLAGLALIIGCGVILRSRYTKRKRV